MAVAVALILGEVPKDRSLALVVVCASDLRVVSCLS